MCSFFTNWLSKMKIRLIPEYECGNKEYTKTKILFYNNSINIHFSLFRESKVLFRGFLLLQKMFMSQF